MKKILVSAALLVALGAPPAGSHGDGDHNLVFANAVPCAAVACSYWPVLGQLGFKACENPFPPGTYVDHVTEPAPTPPAGKKMLLVVLAFPQVDWDGWTCGLLADGSHNGGLLAQWSVNLGDNCDNVLGNDNPSPFGCEEKGQSPAEAGKRYVLRAYNFYDPFPMPAKYRWVFV